MQLEQPKKQQLRCTRSTDSEAVSITLLQGKENLWTPGIENASQGSLELDLPKLVPLLTFLAHCCWHCTIVLLVWL